MNLNDVLSEWGSFTDRAKKQKCVRALRQIADYVENNDIDMEIVYSALEIFIELEQDDGFGTEGLDI